MPQALEVDHEQVKAVALQIGVREAAKQFGLKECTVLQWSRREKWFGNSDLIEQARAAKIEKQGLTQVVTKTASEIMLNYKGKTKLAQAKAVYKTAKHFSKLDPETLAHKTQEVKNNVDSGTKLWPEEQGNNLTQINVNLLHGVELRDV